MSTAITPPPPGWYPASDGTETTWWWTGASRLPPRSERAVLRTITKLATATQVMVIVCGVLALVLVGVEAMGITALTSYLDGNTSAVETLHLYDWTWIVGNALATLSMTAAATLWATWQYRVALQVAGLTRRAATRRRPTCERGPSSYCWSAATCRRSAGTILPRSTSADADSSAWTSVLFESSRRS
ncbi:hypothetical protein [Microbacterium maritypicum]|uniref:hypothetical protein n=1 Tax=Microbacterium maritypicum TaxID=33918 RepID=UPI0037FC9327